MHIPILNKNTSDITDKKGIEQGQNQSKSYLDFLGYCQNFVCLP